MSDTKRRQKPKKGKVYRLNPDLQVIIEEERLPGETTSDTVRRLFGLTGDVRYVLPSDLHESVEDARGAAVVRAVRARGKREKPIPVRPAAK